MGPMRGGNCPLFFPLKPAFYLLLLMAALALPAAMLAQDKPVVYNDMEGDEGAVLDRQIKGAYGAKYTIVDTNPSVGYSGPNPVAGEMPKAPTIASGRLLGGYVLIVYIVSAQGLVTDPVVITSSDRRLQDAALAAMAAWRFTPGTIRGSAVATTAAQEFNFGPRDFSNGYLMKRFASYQSRDVLIRRMPPAEAVSRYLADLKDVAHNFFVGDSTPETLHIVVVVRPGLRSRIWLVSSIRPGNSPDLEPLHKLLLAVKPLDVKEGPALLALSGTVAGGDGSEPLEGDAYRNPVPAQWRELAKALPDPPAYSTDAFIDLLWPDDK